VDFALSFFAVIFFNMDNRPSWKGCSTIGIPLNKTYFLQPSLMGGVKEVCLKQNKSQGVAWGNYKFLTKKNYVYYQFT